MFRDESDDVIEKIKQKAPAKPRSKASSRSPSDQSQSTSPSSDESLYEEKSPVKSEVIPLASETTFFPLSPYSMVPSLDIRARHFFVAHATMWNPTFELAERMCSATDGDETLLASMSAVGLASFSNSIHEPSLMNKARMEYVTALRLTNAALRSPTEVTKDSTLFAVMILSIFEVVAGSTDQSLVAWTEHIDGAATLIKLRGFEQFKTEFGQRMFQQVTSNLMISCIQRVLPMPSHIIELREEVGRIVGTSNEGWKISGIIVDFTVFRAAVRNCQIVGLRTIVEAGLRLDQRFVEAFEAFSDRFRYRTVYSNEHPEVIWNRFYYVYKDAFAPQLWNAMRACRILLHEMIRDQVLTSNAAMTPIFSDEEAATILSDTDVVMQDMQAGILASVPLPSTLSMNDPGISSKDNTNSHFILWPLYLTAVMHITTENLRVWVINRLQLMSEELDILQARLFAEFLENKEMVEPWAMPTAIQRCEKFWKPYRKGILERVMANGKREGAIAIAAEVS